MPPDDVPAPVDDTTPMERLLTIKSLPLFRDVEAEELMVIAEHARRHRFAAGDVLFSRATGPIDRIHLVVDGRVAERRFDRPFRMHEPMQFVGAVDLLAGTDTPVEAVAELETCTLAIDAASLRAVLEDNFGILSVALRGAADASMRLRRRSVPDADAPAPPPDAADDADEALVDLGARIAWLRRSSLAGLKVRTLGQLARDAEPVDVARGTRLWSAGDDAGHAIVPLRGRVEHTVPDGGRPFRTGPGACAGLEEALALAPRWTTATAIDDVTLLRLSRVTLVDALEDDPAAALDLLRILAGGASALRDRLARETAA